MNILQYFSTIDVHVAGEAFRIVTNSSIKFYEENIEKANDRLRTSFTHEKNLLLNEPRGHRGMHGCLVLPTKLADVRVLFFQHEADNPFKYEGLIAVITALLETGTLAKKANERYTIETIHGIYTVAAPLINGEVTAVSLEFGRCEVMRKTTDVTIVEMDHTRNYVLYPLPSSIQSIEREHLAAIQAWGDAKVTELSKEGILYEGVILFDKSESIDEVCSVTFEKDGYILRSPGIDASCALLAMTEGMSQLRNESLFGSHFAIQRHVNEEKQFIIRSEAFITGTHEFVLDREDPLPAGFLLT